MNQSHERYLELRQRLSAMGLFEPDTRAYVLRCCWMLPAYGLGWWLLLRAPDLGGRVALLAVLGFCCVQSAAIAHEAAHGAVTRDKLLTSRLGQIFMTLLMGASYAMWCHKHGAHHRHSNTGQDPDIRSRIFNFNEDDAQRSRGLSRWVTRHQHVLIWPASTLMGFSLKIGGINHVLKHRAALRSDGTALMVHYLLWLVVPAFFIGLPQTLMNYALMTWFSGIHLAFIFMTNHMGRPAEEGSGQARFMHRQAGSARNLGHSWLLARICNGLNSHIEHHLFCNISYSRLHLARPLTKQTCIEAGVPYHEVGVAAAFREFYRHNRAMARAARADTGAAPRIAG
jgi:fatty acid desaturase